MKPAALAFSLVLAAASTQAFYLDGNDLVRMAGDSNRVPMARGFVMGVADAHRNITSCIPTGVASSQLVDITLRFIQENPDKRHLAAETLTSFALSQVWPCPTQPGKTL